MEESASVALVLISPNDFSDEYQEQPDRYESDHGDVKATLKRGFGRKTEHKAAG
jgi:hypothetical protein